MKKFIFIFTCILAITISLQAKSIVSDTLSYKYKTFEKHSINCVKKDSLCAVFKVEYPVFENAAFNNIIQQEILKIFQNNNEGSVKKLTSFDDASKPFLNDYDQNIKEQKAQAKADGNRSLDDFQTMAWNMEAITRVEKQTGKYIIIHTTTDWFTGGAHPVGMEYNYVYDAKTYKRFFLKDLFKPGYEPRLLKIAETLFRKQENLKASDKLNDENGYFFENGKFKLNDNFMVTNKSILFLYNVYEIKPYAAGTTILEIPFEVIKTLLK